MVGWDVLPTPDMSRLWQQSAWALLQVLSALEFPCLEEGLRPVLNGQGISRHEGLLDGM